MKLRAIKRKPLFAKGGSVRAWRYMRHSLRWERMVNKAVALLAAEIERDIFTRGAL